MKTIKIQSTPPKRGLCPVRPPLDGSKGNPMRVCGKAKNHRGKHSWELEGGE